MTTLDLTDILQNRYAGVYIYRGVYIQGCTVYMQGCIYTGVYIYRGVYMHGNLKRRKMNDDLKLFKYDDLQVEFVFFIQLSFLNVY